MVGERVRASLRALAELGQVGFLFLWLEQDIHLSSLMAAPACGEGLSYSGPMPGHHPAVSSASLWAEGGRWRPCPRKGLRSAGLLFMVADGGGQCPSLVCVCVGGGGGIEDRKDNAL